LNFVYSREGEARLDARMYLQGKGDDLFWDPEALPSFPFQVIELVIIILPYYLCVGGVTLCVMMKILIYF
jgi:hypothetical protein